VVPALVATGVDVGMKLVLVIVTVDVVVIVEVMVDVGGGGTGDVVFWLGLVPMHPAFWAEQKAWFA